MVGQKIAPSAELFKEVKLFEAFKDTELQSLCKIGSTLHFEAYTNIVIEGEQSWGIYLILSGTVGVFKASQLGSNLYDVGQLTTGNFFGEMSLVDSNPRSATVRALTECQLYYVSKEAFQTLLNRSSDLKLRFYENCAKTLVTRLRELNDHYVISQYQLWKRVLNQKGKAA